MSNIGHIGSHRLHLPLLDRLSRTASSSKDGGPTSFIEMMQSGVNKVNDAQNKASASVHELLTGGDIPEVEVFSSVQKADLAFRMLVQVRNKLMQAYEEINAIRI
jgi:flagellar hook-basal body complex protein FliE